MKKQAKKILVTALALSLIIPNLSVKDAEAASKPKLSKKTVSVKVGKKKKIKIKGIAKSKIKKTTWKIKNKKIAKLSKKKNNSVIIKAKKKGKTKLIAKVKTSTKTYKIKATVKVKANSESTDPATTDDTKTTAAPTSTPQATDSTSADPTIEPTVEPTAEPTAEPVYSNDFEDGLGDWYARYNVEQNIAELSISSEAYEGEGAMLITGRLRPWNSPGIDMLDTLEAGGTYKVSFWAKVPDNDTAYDYKNGLPLFVSAAYKTTEDAEEEYCNYPADTYYKIYQDDWTLVETEFTLPSTLSSYVFYIETNGKGEASYLIDNFSITLVSLPGQYDPTLDSIKDTYADYIDMMGVATSYSDLLNDNNLGFINHHFNSITMGNEMKMDAIMSDSTLVITDEAASEYVVSDEYAADEDNQDEDGNVIVPVIDFTKMDAVLKIAQENGLKVRIHSPLWHQQNPQQFFTKQFTTGDDAIYTSEENMLAREEMYIRTLMEHIFNCGYGDVVYAYDVVNEYTHMSTADEGNYWAKIFGDEMKTDCEYVKKAYAVAYDECVNNNRTDISLIYNDYSTYDEVDTIIELINNINAKDDTYNPDGNMICDGIGMQSHINDTSTTAEKYETAIAAFAAEGYEIQITELDITSTGTVTSDTSDEDKEAVWAANAELYGEIMTAILTEKLAGANITSVTIWGTTDATSWRSTKAPLLFGESLADTKPSFYAFINAAKELAATE